MCVRQGLPVKERDDETLQQARVPHKEKKLIVASPHIFLYKLFLGHGCFVFKGNVLKHF